jgi:glycosyltransferase involved in cell wall biosynthesis
VIKNMNVLYIAKSSQIGGEERCLQTLLLGLEGTDIVPLALCPAEGPLTDIFRRMGVRTILRNLAVPSLKRPLAALRDFLWLRSLLRKVAIGLVHVNGSITARKSVLAARAAGVPLICHIHYPLGKDYYSWVFKRLPVPNALIFVCDDLQRELGGLLKGLYPAASQHVVYNGLDTAQYPPFDSSNPIPRIGIVANLQAVKGHEDFLQMAALLLGSGVRAHFDIIGDDIQKQGRKKSLQDKARELGLEASVTFWGFVDNVVERMQQLDILVCSSYVEATPRCIIEAMSCRKPIVATRINGIPDVLDDGINGLLVEPGKPEQLFAAVKRLLDDPGLRRNLAYAACAKVNGLYGVKPHVENIRRIYAQVS